MSLKLLRGWLPALLAGLLLVPAPGRAGEPGEVRDLAYGLSLYHFFQDRYFSAITDLMAARQRQRLAQQQDEADLLLGSLYLAYGLEKPSGELFERILERQVAPAVADRVWFNLARLRHEQGQYDQAVKALERIGDGLPAEREAERQNLLANIHLRRGEYDQAIAVLADFAGEGAWKAYARFNLGVALVKAGREEEGARQLEAVGRMEATTPELKALRDQANIALGFAWLRAERAKAAAAAFARVRLHGPLSNKALLGMGWARARQERLQESLVPWLELKARSPLDPAVQESLLAIPYTIERLEKPKLALVHYTEASVRYEQQLAELKRLREAVAQGELLQALRPGNLDDESGESIYRGSLPPALSVPYLYRLLASNAFRSALRNHQDLQYLRYVLGRWERYLPVFTLMLRERRTAYEKKLPAVSSDLLLERLEDFRRRRAELAAEVARVEREIDLRALADEDEAEWLDVLADVRRRLERLGSGADLEEELAKYRLFKGILIWRIESDFVPRLWRLKRGLQRLDQALAETEKQYASLQRAWKIAPRTFEGFDDRIRGQYRRIKTLQGQVDAALKAQQRAVQTLALAEIDRQQDRLKSYLVRARFAQARLYDKLMKMQPPPADLIAPPDERPGAPRPTEKAPGADTAPAAGEARP